MNMAELISGSVFAISICGRAMAFYGYRGVCLNKYQLPKRVTILWRLVTF